MSFSVYLSSIRKTCTWRETLCSPCLFPSSPLPLSPLPPPPPPPQIMLLVRFLQFILLFGYITFCHPSLLWSRRFGSSRESVLRDELKRRLQSRPYHPLLEADYFILMFTGSICPLFIILKGNGGNCSFHNAVQWSPFDLYVDAPGSKYLIYTKSVISEAFNSKGTGNFLGYWEFSVRLSKDFS